MAIKCPKCKTDNPETASFCADCGTQLILSEEVSAPTETLEAAKEELTTGTTFAGRYQIIEELGKGGMGKVYRVIDKKLKEEVALKLIKPEIGSDKKTVERFSNELKLARKIVHKNVARMFDLNEERETNYITMEYVRGEDLKRLIRKIGQLSARQVIPIAMQICEGLIEAHRLGVIHRDLKPQNIMVDEEGNARIMDFGIARSITGKGITGFGIMIGTPEYMSPEQVEGKEVDQRSDIYSLGVILYEMITGRVPFEGETPLNIAYKHKHEIPQDPKKHNSQIPEDLSRLILKCLEKNPNKRYNTPQNLIYELQKILKELLHNGEEVSVVTESSASERSQRANKHLQRPRHATLDKELAKIIAYSQLLIKNDIIHVTFNLSERIVTAINEITKKILWDSDEIFFINQGGGEVTCIFDREKEALFQPILPKAREIKEKIAIIRIKEPKGKGFTSGIEIPGLYAFFINQLSDIGISILDIISTASVLTLVIAEEDLVQAYSALSDSVKYFRKKEGKIKP